VRILHLASSLGPHGTPRFLAHLAIGLQQKSVEQRILTMAEEAPFAELLRSGGVPVERIPTRNRWDIVSGRTIIRRIADFAPDVLHVWGYEAAWLVNAAQLLRVKMPPYVFSNLGPNRDSVTLRSFLKNAKVEWNSTPVVELSSATPVALGLPMTARAIVNVGRFDATTDQREAVWIYDIVKHTSPALHLVIVGDGPERAKVERFAESLAHGEKRVHFLGLRTDVPAVLANASVVLLTHHTGSRTAALEAMAAGKPIVAYTTPGLTSLNGHTTAMRLVPQQDRLSAAKALHAILDDATTANQLGEAGRRVAEQHCVESALPSFVELYRRVKG
jgi:glycosyltransferase involved in cell wall biosynthesis